MPLCTIRTRRALLPCLIFILVRCIKNFRLPKNTDSGSLKLLQNHCLWHIFLGFPTSCLSKAYATFSGCLWGALRGRRMPALPCVLHCCAVRQNHCVSCTAMRTAVLLPNCVLCRSLCLKTVLFGKRSQGVMQIFVLHFEQQINIGVLARIFLRVQNDFVKPRQTLFGGMAV